jgi:hypothetical protein
LVARKIDSISLSPDSVLGVMQRLAEKQLPRMDLNSVPDDHRQSVPSA